MNTLTPTDYASYWDQAISYQQYVTNVEKEAATNPIEGNSKYVPINLKRMQRIQKTYTLSPVAVEILNQLNRPIRWLVITENWCGDSAQSTSVMEKMAEASNWNIEMRFIYRDANPVLMNAHLTGASMSIPKVIQLDGAFHVTGSWGPRPDKAQQLVLGLKSNPATAHSYSEELHRWYARDKQAGIEIELLKLIEGAIPSQSAAAQAAASAAAQAPQAALSAEITVHYIGAATALLEIGGLRILTDPAFDGKQDYPLGPYTLSKVQDPVVTASQLGRIDYVLLSHDHHLDNLDHSGQQLLTRVKTVFTTPSGAQRLNSGGLRPGETTTPTGIHAVGLENWETVEVPTPDGRIITIMGTPCRHGPIGGDRGPVTGFVLDFKEGRANENKLVPAAAGPGTGAVYITGDTVWYEGVEEVAKRCQNIGLILLFLGAARLKVAGPANITMTVAESINVASLFDKATIVPLHFEGWAHFTEGYDELIKQYTTFGLLDRLSFAPPYADPSLFFHDLQ